MLQYFGPESDAGCLLKPREVCQILRVTNIELWRMTRSGELPVAIIGNATRRYRFDVVWDYRNRHLDELVARVASERRQAELAALEDSSDD